MAVRGIGLPSFGLGKLFRRFAKTERNVNVSDSILVFLWKEIQLPGIASRGYCTSEVSSVSNVIHGQTDVFYQRGFPVVTVPLPSRREKCRFSLRPVSSTVNDFIRDLKNEDHGIDRVHIQTTDGIRIAASTSIETLMQEDFHLIINDFVYCVSPPPLGKLTAEEMKDLSDVKRQVAKLYGVLHVDEHQIEQERKLIGELEELRQKLEPLENKKAELEAASHRRTSLLTWIGLGLMGAQFGVLARLTWWEYSWDIMEPVTYFITYGTSIAMYAYFVLSKQEYNMPDVKDREFLLNFYKKAKKSGLDMEKYNSLRDTIYEKEEDLKRLRDPLQLHLPIKESTLKFDRSLGQVNIPKNV
ncbi:calcium uniporter protein, mitochondrial-like isoform X3 [Tachypleus tridentatus]|uniref:calcium uniporter protein, mitochondrial-like isoform X3 n=1 Tax=Tachypleus tridentatus TaxID=6853 RepID=UPI003FD59206